MSSDTAEATRIVANVLDSAFGPVTHDDWQRFVRLPNDITIGRMPRDTGFTDVHTGVTGFYVSFVNPEDDLPRVFRVRVEEVTA